MKTIAVIDYGMSNLHSVNRALEYVAVGNLSNWKVIVSSKASEIIKADKVVFPGQGAIGNCMKLLADTGLDEAIHTTIHTKPFLGICLGLQTLLTDSDESGGKKGFNFVKGTVKHFIKQADFKIPHMGWNQVKQKQEHFLWQGIPNNSRFYFVHSYHAVPENNKFIAATTEYPQDFVSAVAFENVFAVQFHPEKSQHNGLKLLENFLAW
jgi:glutamine amidotransferase